MIPRSPAPHPVNAESLRQAGLAHAVRGELAPARDLLEAALRQEPGHVGSLVNLAIVYQGLGDASQALACLEQALLLKPDVPEAWNNQSLLLSELGRFTEAITSAERAITLRPRYPEALNNLGRARHALGRRTEALAAYDQAIACAPDYPAAHANRAAVQLELGNPGSALVSAERALTLNPHSDFLLGVAQHLRMKICDWNKFDDRIHALQSPLRAGAAACSPFAALALFDDPALHLQSARHWAARKLPKGSALKPLSVAPINHQHRSDEAPTRKIRLGYFSADFYHHATTHLMTGLIEEHDRDRFEVYGFSFGPDPTDTAHQRIRSAFDQFFDVRQLGDADVASLARTHGIDIAIDLKGYTQDSRAGIFVHRAAPIQVSFLGYPGSLGGAEMDYIVMDDVLAPLGSEMFYSERIIRLPGSYQVNDARRETAFHTPSRSDCGLPTDRLVLACFNNSYKILPATFASWMRILAALPESVLWLLPDNVTARDNLRAAAKRHGIEGERLVFAPRVATAEHLARHVHVDLFLDTFPYNAHTTASDALWMGVPLVTLAGKSFASRVAASLLHAVGLPELVTHTQKEYETLIIQLARAPAERARLRERLLAARHDSSLFDTVHFARKLEAAFLSIITPASAS